MAARYTRLSDALGLPSSEIVKRLRAGDESVYSQLVDATWKPLWRYSATILADSEAAQDVVADAFTWLWTNRHTIDATGSLDSLLFTVVRNRSISVIRADHRYRARLDQIESDDDAEGDNDEIDGNPPNAQQNIDQLLSTLPVKYREAIELRWIQQLPIEEVAATMQISEAAAYKTLQRAMRKLEDAALRLRPPTGI